MTATLSKRNEAIEFKAVPNDLIRNLKFTAWSLVIGNLTALLICVILEPRFADAAIKYSFLTLTYITSLICTMFALKDNNNVMLYPILVTTKVTSPKLVLPKGYDNCDLPAVSVKKKSMKFQLTKIAFIVFPLSAWFFMLINRFYCLHMDETRPFFSYVDCGDYQNISLIRFIPLLLIAFEKLLEFIIFRRLMKIFELQRFNAHFGTVDLSKAFSTRNDTDDEIIVYERVTKGCQTSYNDYGTYKSSA